MSQLDAPSPRGVPGPLETILERIGSQGCGLVALSGGVDSALVASFARETLGVNAVAVTITGTAVAQAEVNRAKEVADAIGIRHVLLSADPLRLDQYRENPANRCYFCRSVETRVVLDWGRAQGIQVYLDGIHRDDLGDERPGIRAMDEAGFSHPLLDAGWGKVEIRAEARRRGLPNWDTPSDACLASRVAHGDPLSAGLLARIELAESTVRKLGFRRVRWRVAGSKARLEVGPDEVERLRDMSILEALRREARKLGFSDLTVDPQGYRLKPSG